MTVNPIIIGAIANRPPTPQARDHARTVTTSAGRIIQGDCTHVMATLPASSVDFILTDPLYITHYRDRSGRTVANDNQAGWLLPAFGQMHRMLKPAAFCVSFYGWNKVDLFMAAWRVAGFRPVGHIVFRKRYASKSGFLRAEHEAAYLLAKGEAPPPAEPIADVLDWRYTGNLLHPTQKPVEPLRRLIAAFCPASGLVLDPFAGSDSTLVAAHASPGLSGHRAGPRPPRHRDAAHGDGGGRQAMSGPSPRSCGQA